MTRIRVARDQCGAREVSELLGSAQLDGTRSKGSDEGLLLRAQNLLRKTGAALLGHGSSRGSAVLLLDLSASMADGRKLEQAREGAMGFCERAWERGMEVGVYGFSARTVRVLSLGRRDGGLARRLARLHPGGGTRMAEAISRGSAVLRRREGERLLCIFTDGLPDCRAEALAAAAAARAEGVAIVALGTEGADAIFLAALAGRRERSQLVPPSDVASALSDAAGPGFVEPEGGR